MTAGRHRGRGFVPFALPGERVRFTATGHRARHDAVLARRGAQSKVGFGVAAVVLAPEVPEDGALGNPPRASGR